MATTMSGESFVSRLRKPLYVASMANNKGAWRAPADNDSPMVRGARKAYAGGMAEIDRLVLERASTLTGLDLVNLPRTPENEEQS